MPNCFTLTRKTELEAGPVQLTLIDEELCAYLGQEVDPDNWVYGWYNSIGLMLAIGKSFEECREIFAESNHLLPIVAYLEANFVTDAWYQHGR
jgi:hypothetical protein